MTKPKTEPSKGVLNRGAASQFFNISRFEPSRALAFFVEHYWIVRWDLRNQAPYEQEILAHPSVQLVFERKNTWFWGVVTGVFTRKLEGKGHVLGVKFKPGAFFPFYKKTITTFQNDVLPFHAVFNNDISALEEDILSASDDRTMANRAESFLSQNSPEPHPKVVEITTIITTVKQNPSILKVDDLLEHFNYSKRTLQRLFHQYVGVSPKWVIQRHRLHEVAEKMAAVQIENWPALAVDAGYFDQAHFIRDFKAIVGKSPAEYARSLIRSSQ